MILVDITAPLIISSLLNDEF